MGKNKLKKFAEIEKLDCVLQFPRQRLLEEGFDKKGKWHSDIFCNANPIVLELGCGKGEYTVSLSKENPDKNFIGIDIKGARLWTGAREVADKDIKNAMFLRTEIENLSHFFSQNEVDEIWITFPDPQMQKSRKRLTSTRFLNLYAQLLKSQGLIHLKTDSPFLFEYTKRLALTNNLEITEISEDIYGEGLADPVKSIKTFYESQWLERGKKIKLITFKLSEKELSEPETEDIEKDDYRAYTRHNPTPQFYNTYDSNS